MTSSSLYDIPLQRIDGRDASLAEFKGKVLLLVNVASKCGLTPQYAGLEKLYREKKAQGLEVLGFPANDFKGQEPGSNQEIASFCSTQYDVSFPLFAKIVVTGTGKHPLYAALTQALTLDETGSGMRERLRGHGITPTEAPEVLWNFEKFLIGRDGRIAARFAPDASPDSDEVRQAIDRELAKAA